MSLYDPSVPEEALSCKTLSTTHQSVSTNHVEPNGHNMIASLICECQSHFVEHLP